MMYPYITLKDETLITHTQIIENNGAKEIEVHFERPTSDGFDSARCLLPSYEWIMREGFTDDEIAAFCKLMEYNAHLLYRYAENGGLQIA